MSPLAVKVTVDVAQKIAPLKPIYRFFGADEPNYAYMKDGRKLLAEIGKLGDAPKYFRAHSLLTSGDLTPSLKWGSTNFYTEDAQGHPVYDFTTVSRIFDAYLETGVRPYVQLGFMPEALSSRPQPYRHEWRPGLNYEIFTGWAYPPTSYSKWRDVCESLTRHLLDRYGVDEVKEWYFECWNEPNIGYWQGTPEEWYQLNDYAIDGVRRAFPAARVGGPHTAGPGGRFMRGFLEHCLRGVNHANGEKGTPLDFIAFHAKGSPSFVDGHVRMGIAAHLQGIESAFRLIAEYPELRGTPIIIGESDPDGCAACLGAQLGYRNGTMYSSYTAASFARKHLLAEQCSANLVGAVTWAFEFEDQPYFAGQRVLASNGIVLPVFNVIRMMAKMSGHRVLTDSSHQVPLPEIVRDGVRAQADVGAIASADAGSVAIMLWHYADDDVAGPDAEVTVVVDSLVQSEHTLTEYRVDDENANAFSVWDKAGRPVAPDHALRDAMLSAARLSPSRGPLRVTPSQGRLELQLRLPRQGVVLLVLAP